MRCVRVIVFILLLIFTAAATCSSLFPLYRRPGAMDGTDTIYYWYMQSSINTIGETYSITRTYNRDYRCPMFRDFYIAVGALAAGGAAFGGIATLMALAHIFIRPKCCMCFGIMFMSFLACACYVVCVAITTYTYLNETCKGGQTMEKIKDQGYKIVEGFGLMCAAAGGFLISILLETCA